MNPKPFLKVLKRIFFPLLVLLAACLGSPAFALTAEEATGWANSAVAWVTALTLIVSMIAGIAVRFGLIQKKDAENAKSLAEDALTAAQEARATLGQVLTVINEHPAPNQSFKELAVTEGKIRASIALAELEDQINPSNN